MRGGLHNFTRLVLASATISMSAPATSAATPAATGIVAALGLQAASGKTTLDGGAGATEASLLDSVALVDAGAIIAHLVDKAGSGHAIIVLAHTDTLTLASGASISKVVNDMNSTLDSTCPASIAVVSGGHLAPSFADAAAVVATDKTIGAVPLTADDRLLIDSIELAKPGALATADDWTVHQHDAAETADGGSTAPGFFSAADVLEVKTGSPLMQAYDKLSKRVAAAPNCTTAAGKAALKAAGDLVTKLTTVGNDGTVPLVEAARQAQLNDMDPYILRVAIEQAGGTTVTRANIWHTLGFPGAATIGTGLLVSFKLTDPASGNLELVGFVRCAIPQANINHVASRLVSPDADRIKASCAYIAR